MKKIKEKWIKRECPLSEEEIKTLAAENKVTEDAIRIAASRGVTDFKAFFSTGHTAPGKEMLDMTKGTKLLYDAILSGKHIRVMGDYDVDGIMSTYILTTGIQYLIDLVRSKAEVSYAIPDRLRDGYGLNKRLVTDALQDEVDVILTCDNGIAAFEAIELARSFGMTVVVTDHHSVFQENGKDQLPFADAVIDPHRADDPTPFPDICGAVVAYKFMINLFSRFKVGKREAGAMFLPYAAVATIADVMPLKGENRNLVKQGLPLIKNSVGLSALCRANKLNPERVSSSDVAFKLSPCCNAAGRIGDVNVVLKLLTCGKEDAANSLADTLVALNDKRKALCAAAEEEAISQVKPSDGVIVVYLPKVHEGIIGIVAGRLKELFVRPAFVFTDSGDVIKGSGRSTDDWNMYVGLLRINEAHPDLILGFGGHPTAAGISLRSRDKLREFKSVVNKMCGIDPNKIVNKILYDEEVSPASLTPEKIDGLSVLEPCGCGNETPVFFMRDLEGSFSMIGKDLRTMKVTAKNMAVLAFKADAAPEQVDKKYGPSGEENRPVKVSVIGTAQLNQYRGEKKPEIFADSYVFV